MSAFGEGAPCWADLSLPDLAAGQRFYGELLGWTFQDQGEEFGHYSMAQRDGKNVAALMPRMDPDQPTAWGVYLATADAAKTAEKVPRPAAACSSARTPSATSASWPARPTPAAPSSACGRATPTPASAWSTSPARSAGPRTSPRTRQPSTPSTAPCSGTRRSRSATESHFDYKVWTVPGGKEPVAGRMKADGQPPAFTTYFVVADCDGAAATVRRLGGQVVSEPQDSPFGRTAVVTDDQGARFAVIDTERKVGEQPGR